MKFESTQASKIEYVWLHISKKAFNCLSILRLEKVVQIPGKLRALRGFETPCITNSLKDFSDGTAKDGTEGYEMDNLHHGKPLNVFNEFLAID